MPVQTRFYTTLNGAISDTDDAITLDDAPAFSSGFGTIDRGEANEEDIFWGDLSGLQVTSVLRGLSKTALTVTEVLANKYTHDDAAVFEGTLLHYIVNNKADLDEDETYTGDNTYTGNNETTGTHIFADDGAETKTTAAPSGDKKFANKKYVDDKFALSIPLSYLDSDVALTADSDTKVPTQKAVKAYVTSVVGAVADVLTKISENETAPNYLEEQVVDDPNGLLLWATVNDGGDETLQPTIQGQLLVNTYRPIETFTAGENITVSSAPRLVFISRGTSSSDTWPLQTQLTENDTDSDVYGVNFYGQTFTTGTYQNRLTRFDLMTMKVGSPSGNIQLDIYAVDGSHLPTGSSLGTKTLVASTLSATALEWTAFTFASEITVSPATEYAAVARVISGDSSNYVEWQTGSGSTYAGGVPVSSSDAGSSYSAATNDYAFRAWGYEAQTAGNIYITDSDEPFRGGADGFITATVLAGASASVRLGGVQTGFTGLTPGVEYFAGTIAGTPTTTNTGLKIGKATSSSAIEIDKADGYVVPSQITTSTMDVATTVISSYIIASSIGFKPSRVDVYAVLTSQTGAAANLRQLSFSGIYRSGYIGNSLKTGGPSASFYSQASMINAASTLTVLDGAPSATVTLGAITLTNNGPYANASIDLTGSGIASVRFVCYR